MIKKTKSISINILSAFIILICLFMGAINETNAWFTAKHNNGVQIQVDVGNLKLKVYQNSVANANEIYSNALNNTYETDNLGTTNPKHVTLSDEIIPGDPVDLVLILANKDAGSTSMFVKFKFEVYVRGVNGDTLLNNISIDGYDEPTETAGGFVKNPNGYYYYQDNAGNNILLNRTDDVVVMKTFTVPLDCFIKDDGTMVYTNSESVYIKLTVDASTNFTF